VGAIEEENGPYRRLTIEWYKDLETGTFLAKLTVEGEGIKEGKREAVFTLSSDRIADVDLLNPSELVEKLMLNSDSLKDLISYIGGDLIRSTLGNLNSMSVADYLIYFFIKMLAEVIARGVMILDANRLKMSLSGEKS